MKAWESWKALTDDRISLIPNNRFLEWQNLSEHIIQPPVECFNMEHTCFNMRIKKNTHKKISNTTVWRRVIGYEKDRITEGTNEHRCLRIDMVNRWTCCCCSSRQTWIPEVPFRWSLVTARRGVNTPDDGMGGHRTGRLQRVLRGMGQ